MPASSTRRSRARRLSVLLLVAGLALLGYWSWAHLDRVASERRAEAELERLLAASAADGHPPIPAIDGEVLPARLPGEDEPEPEPTGEDEEQRPAPSASPAAEERSAPAAPPVAARAVKTPPLGRLEVPRLGLSAIVLPGTDRRTLRRAVGHIEGTARPGEPGTVGLAGHRDSHFRPLERIAPGDEIVLTTPAGRFRYEVGWTEIVQPHEVDVLATKGEPYLTLVTCYPFDALGAAPDRFIVQARQVGGPGPAT